MIGILILIVLTGCRAPTELGPEADLAKIDAGRVHITIADRLNAHALLPDVSMDAAEFRVHGAGVSGLAEGLSVDIVLTPTKRTQSLSLASGQWDFDCTAWNDDDPSVAVGGASASADVVIGQSTTVLLNCYPYEGTGAYDLQVGWAPDVLVDPSVEAELRGHGGTLYPVPVEMLSDVAAAGTLALEQGWYVAFTRLLDSGELSAGIVETARIAFGATTYADYFLDAVVMEGEIIIDVDWTSYGPLAVETDTPEGEVGLYQGQTQTVTITGADNDVDTSLAYGWYVDGAAVAVSSTPSYTLDSAEYEIGVTAYLSAIVWQSDGKRMGDAQWTLRVGDPATVNVAGTVRAMGSWPCGVTVEVRDDNFGLLTDVVILGISEGEDVPYEFSFIPAGDYYVRAYHDLDDNGAANSGDWVGYQGTDSNTPPPAPNVIIPHAPGVTYNVSGMEQL